MGGDRHEGPLFETVITFAGTMQAMRAEKKVKAVGVVCRLVPTPRELSSTCALALAFARADREVAGAALADDGWRVEAAYDYPADGNEPLPWEP